MSKKSKINKTRLSELTDKSTISKPLELTDKPAPPTLPASLTLPASPTLPAPSTLANLTGKLSTPTLTALTETKQEPTEQPSKEPTKETTKEPTKETTKEEKNLGFIGRILEKFINGVKSIIYKKIDSGKTTPPLKTEQEKQLAKDKVDKMMDILQTYMTKIFWKKLKKSGILKRLKVKGISGILVSLLSIIPGAGPAIGAPIKAFFIFYTTYMDLSSKYQNEITIIKKAFEALRNNKDMQETIDLAIKVVEHQKSEAFAQDKIEKMLKKGGKKTRKLKKYSKKTRKSKKKKYKSRKQKNLRKKHTRKY
tara:strand:- start:4420 stop:5346 length:927 start_codon:yes stop_codon:yes gene_type:complete